MTKAETESDELVAIMEDGEYDGAALIVDLDGFGGPLHLLLSLAKEQKVDLLRISILKLADQYLDFIHRAKKERIELAADYLVMASWLAYLKSRMLLPKKENAKDEMAPELLSSHLAWRLKRLEAMRNSGLRIFNLPQLGQEIFTRGETEEVNIENFSLYEADLLDLLSAYCKQRNKVKAKVHRVKPWPVYSLEEARANLRAKLPNDGAWHDLAEFAPKEIEKMSMKPSIASCYASLLSAGLEMVKQGDLQMRQVTTYDNIFLQRVLKQGAQNGG